MDDGSDDGAGSDEGDDAGEVVAEGETAVPFAPQLRIDADGNIVMDEESLQVTAISTLAAPTLTATSTSTLAAPTSSPTRTSTP